METTNISAGYLFAIWLSIHGAVGTLVKLMTDMNSESEPLMMFLAGILLWYLTDIRDLLQQQDEGENQ